MGRAFATVLAGTMLLSACASTRPPTPADAAAEARAADDAALEAAAGELAPLEDHYVAVAGGRLLGGAMLLDDAARLLAEGAAGLPHAYFFVQGCQGDCRAPIPALYGPRVAGCGLLQALGLEFCFDPGEGILTLRRGDRVRAFRTGGGPAAAVFTVEPASGLGPAVDMEFIVSSGFAGTALVSPEDAAAAGLARSEIPGTVTLAEALSGRTLPCRRALVRVSLAGFDQDPDLKVSAVVEVLFPR